MKEYIGAQLEAGPVTYLDLSHGYKLPHTLSKAHLIDYYLENSQTLTAAIEVCTLVKDAVKCQYYFYPLDPSAEQTQGKVLSVTVCAISKKPYNMDFEVLAKCLEKYAPKAKTKTILMTDIKVPEKKKEANGVVKKQVVAGKEKKGFEKQSKLNVSSFVSKKRAEILKPEPMIESTPIPSEPQEASQEKEELVPTIKVKREREPSPEPSPEPSQEEKTPKEFLQRTKKLKVSDTESESGSSEKMVDLKPEVENYKEVTKTRTEKKTRFMQDENGYLVAEDYYETVEYTEKIKVKPQKEEEDGEKAAGVKKSRKKDPHQMDLSNFFKRK